MRKKTLEYKAYRRRKAIERYHRRMRAAREHFGSVCGICGSTEDLEFDHIDRTTKLMTVADAAASASDDIFWAEVAKCQLLCVAHHLEKGYSAGDIKSKAVHGSAGMYRHNGCRCSVCRAAQSARERPWKMAYRERQRQKSA